MAAKRILIASVLALVSVGFAHLPRFPTGVGPFEVDAPTISKAYYLHLGAGERHTFTLPALDTAVPVQVLVLDDDLGRSLELVATAVCGNVRTGLARLDQPFYEPFSRLHHRYRVVDTVGPTDGPCAVEVRELSGGAGPYVFVVGDVERFGAREILGLLNLDRRLRAWQAGP